MCRKHKACSPDGIDNMYRETRPQPPDVIVSTDDSENTHEAMPTASAASDMPENDSQSYVRNMCLFYLKLQGQLLIPASTIQTIVEEMQNVHELVLMCVEDDLKRFGVAKVFSELLADLKSLETDGINVDGQTVKGGLYCIAGDNLGSHCIGGFTENFSRSQYFCRYCEITRSEFVADPNVCCPLRTPETYDTAVADLQTENIQEVRGIKVNSVFNALETFHVSQPGLPPCLGHDLFEGVLSYDLTLYLKNIIKKKKWFTYSLLNRRIKQLKYKGSEALTKPCAVNTWLNGQRQVIRASHSKLEPFEIATSFDW
ncbi:Dynein heavy chain-like protein [Labeo rohita]|uniref:Dynein heavy chain-like protein n=1 Tax=Labeo rohita TaxID=84645 RepID=A0ABQ8L489_LABRO|nr:Dynein heavy chain-like protein [Labeo rohita]